MGACEHGAPFVEGPPYPGGPPDEPGRYCPFCGAGLREVEAARAAIKKAAARRGREAEAR